ncbi:MAG: 50S ribosomal protein L30 [Thermoplasmata archaeon]|nr:50S ribosomal protein L30 [Candidatus Sysuiplasma jiujiangense]
MMYAVIRVRGHGKIKRKAVVTLEQMHLSRVNHMVLLPETETTRRMLQIVKDYVTWGEISGESIEKLMNSAFRLEGDRKPSPGEIEKTSGMDRQSLVRSLSEGSKRLPDLKLKKVVRLHPPRQGWEAVKKDYATGGSLGYRGGEINTLIGRMIPMGGVNGNGKQNE